MDAKWLLGGACAVAGLGLLLYNLSDDGREAGQATSLSREQLLAVLRDIKKETSSVLIMIASYAQSVKEQVGDKIDEASMKEILTAQSPMKDMMNRSETKVYEKHGVSKEQVKQAYHVDFKDDPYRLHSELKRISRELQEASNNAFRGVAPQCEAQLPQFLTPELVINLMKAMYDATARVTFKKLNELRKQGIQMSPYDPRFMAATQTMESEVEEEK